MSRSYKKFTVSKDQNSKFGKRMASRAIRREKSVQSGGDFRKYYCSWNICDYRSPERFYTAEEFRRKWYDKTYRDLDWMRSRFRTCKEAYRHWLRWYRMK